MWLWDFMYNEKEEIVSSITPNLNSIHWTRALCVNWQVIELVAQH